MKRTVNIVDIPVKMEKFYGVGKMLHPDIEMVESAIRIIPPGKLALMEALGSKLARDVGADISCPMRIANAVKKISEKRSLPGKDNTLSFWRVIRNNYLLPNSKSTWLCIERLEEEGFELIYTEKGEIKVNDPQDRLFRF